MPRAVKPPAYLKGKQRTAGGHYARCVLFGQEINLGTYGTPESIARHQEVVAQWRTIQATGGPRVPLSAVTVADLAAAFLRTAEQEGRYLHPDGTSTRELEGGWVPSLRPLLRLHGSTLVRDFRPSLLKEVRKAAAEGSWLTKEEQTERQRKARSVRWARKTINQRIGRIIRLFGWGVGEELVPVEVHQALLQVEPLPVGSRLAVDHPDVLPVPPQDVDDTLPRLGPTPRALVLLQLVTGMRPGEACAMRRADIDCRGLRVDGVDVWVLRPGGGDRHKTAHHGIKRAIPLGPAAQFVLRPFVEAGGEWVFPAPRKKGSGYCLQTYIHDVLKAARRCGVPDWTPNQLRKARATEIEEQVDLDTARAQLGHTSSATTKRFYAKADLQVAARAARRLG